MKNIFAISIFYILTILFSFNHCGAENIIAQGKVKTACYPGICQPRSKISKTYRPLISLAEGLITLKPRKGAQEFFYDQPDSARPQILVPAKRKIIPACSQSATGKFSCHDVVSYDGCPTTIEFTAESPVGDTVLNCDLNCEPNTPNSEGLCDCQTSNCVVAR